VRQTATEFPREHRNNDRAQKPVPAELARTVLMVEQPERRQQGIKEAVGSSGRLSFLYSYLPLLSREGLGVVQRQDSPRLAFYHDQELLARPKTSAHRRRARRP